MIRFFTISTLRESIHNYCRRDEYGYKNCKNDICDFFREKNIVTIFNQPILISPSKNFNFIKSRIDNSTYNKGKSGGYRLYYYVDSVNEYVYLLGFFPKTGKYGREDLTDTEVKIMIKKFAEEKKNGILEEHYLDLNLKSKTEKEYEEKQAKING